jgi:hypothetical protein
LEDERFVDPVVVHPLGVAVVRPTAATTATAALLPPSAVPTLCWPLLSSVTATVR